MFDFAPRAHDENIVPTEWVGVLSNASAIADIATGAFGDHVFYGTGPNPAIEWTFHSDGGEREVWAQYAALVSRPVAILVNGLKVSTVAMWETTGGWKDKEQTSSFQFVHTFNPGYNVIRVEGNGELPHIRSVSACHKQHERVDVGTRYAKCQAFLHSNDTQFSRIESGDFDAANDLIAKLRRRGLSPSGISDVFQKYIEAHKQTQNDMTLLGGFGGPFNGERLRMRIVNDVSAVVSFSAFIETGAYVGTTTEFFAQTGMPVLSCEAMLDNFLVSTLRLSRYKNAKLVLSDSRSFLRQTMRDAAELLRCPLIYLDAHWFDDLPLPEELDIIFSNLDSYFVVVDDFEVPGSKYFYDRYQNGNELTYKFVIPKLDLSTNPVFMVPSNASTEETGPRKGTMFVAPRKLYEEKLQYIGRLTVVDVSRYL